MTYIILFLDGTKMIMCGKRSNRHRESDNPTLGYNINRKGGKCGKCGVEH